MPSRRKRERSHAARRAPARTPRRASPPRPAAVTDRRITELTEALEIMLPELSARLAAVEHLLIEKKLCTRDDLLRAREFVDLRRGPS